jgi:hypothetical protein
MRHNAPRKRRAPHVVVVLTAAFPARVRFTRLFGGLLFSGTTVSGEFLDITRLTNERTFDGFSLDDDASIVPPAELDAYRARAAEGDGNYLRESLTRHFKIAIEKLHWNRFHIATGEPSTKPKPQCLRPTSGIDSRPAGRVMHVGREDSDEIVSVVFDPFKRRIVDLDSRVVFHYRSLVVRRTARFSRGGSIIAPAADGCKRWLGIPVIRRTEEMLEQPLR